MAKGGGIPSGRAATPLEEAQDLMYEAWDPRVLGGLNSPARLWRSPPTARTRTYCWPRRRRARWRTRGTLRPGCRRRRTRSGPRDFEEAAGDFWSILETRPYMRAREGLAYSLWKLGEREAAIGHYKEMLRLNPHDNQGMRYILLDCLLAMGRDDEAGALLAEYEDDGTAAGSTTTRCLPSSKAATAPNPAVG